MPRGIPNKKKKQTRRKPVSIPTKTETEVNDQSPSELKMLRDDLRFEQRINADLCNSNYNGQLLNNDLFSLKEDLIVALSVFGKEIRQNREEIIELKTRVNRLYGTDTNQQLAEKVNFKN